MKFRLILFTLFLTSNITAESIGSLFIGSNSFSGSNKFKPLSFAVEPGLTIGFLLPINFPIIDVHYKVRSAFGSVFVDRYQGREEWNYIAASNVLLVGKRLPFSARPITVLPQLGLGLIYENIYDEWGTGYVYNLLFVDFSTRVEYSLQKHKFGFMLNYEKGIATSMIDYHPMNRIIISLVYSI